MRSVRDLLNRFRPAGAPGAAGAAGATGVPADRREAVAVELGPVFATLAQTVVDCADLRRSGRADRERVVAEAEKRAQAVVAEARAGAGAHRSAAAARLMAVAQVEADQVAARAREEADAIRRRGEQERATHVARVVARVRADLLSEPDPEARP